MASNPIMRKLKYALRFLPDKTYIQLYYFLRFKKFADLKNPKTFNEKLNWLKLNDRNPLYTTLVDKYEVKKYVADKIGAEYIIPTLGVWDRFDDIDFDKLPNQFVLKCTHDSEGLVIVKDKSALDINAAKAKIESALKQNFYYIGREWPYKNVKPRIIAEKYMEDHTDGELRDYKFYCFNGQPMFCQVIANRFSDETIDFFDIDWKHQEFTGVSLPMKNFSKDFINKPYSFTNMVKNSSILSNTFNFVRVDFYEVNKHLYFGELTFYPAGGFGSFYPDIWNYKIGEHLKICNNIQK